MTSCARQAEEIELYFYDELEPAVRAAVGGHLRSCAACRQALDELATMRSALMARPWVEAPPDGDWTAFMRRLAEASAAVKVDYEPASWNESSRVLASRARTEPDRARVSRASLLAMAALVTLVTAGVVYVARSGPRPVPASVANVPQDTLPAPDPTAAPASASPRSANAAFAALSEQHFERSKLVVLGLASKDPARAREADWAYERGLATHLLSDTRLYRQAAEARGMRQLAGVMGDLEIVLLQTALAEAPDGDALGQIQRLIEKRGLVTKMDSAAASTGS